MLNLLGVFGGHAVHFTLRLSKDSFYKSISIRVSVTRLDHFEQLPQSHVASE